MRRPIVIVSLVVFALAVTGGLIWRGHGWGATPFDRVVLVGDRELRVEWTGGQCDDEWRVEVDQSRSVVALLVRQRVVARECNDAGVPRSETVTLDGPLGDREVVDLACEAEATSSRAPCRAPVVTVTQG